MLLRALIAGVVSGALTAWIGWSSWIPDTVAFHSVALAVIGAIYMGFAFSYLHSSVSGRPTFSSLSA